MLEEAIVLEAHAADPAEDRALHKAIIVRAKLRNYGQYVKSRAQYRTYSVDNVMVIPNVFPLALPQASFRPDLSKFHLSAPP